MPNRPYVHIRRESQRNELDRDTWATSLQVVVTYETLGVGELISPLIDFGTVFQGSPFFSYGVEIVDVTTLVSGDYPFVTAGVSSWETSVTEDERAAPRYMGAYVWMRVFSSTAYRLRFRLSFEGLAYRNTQYLRNQSG